MTVRVAVVQMNAGDNVEENTAFLTEWAARAAAEGASWVCTPENSECMANLREPAQPEFREADHPVLAAMQRAASIYGVWVWIGSLAILPEEPQADGRVRHYNRSFAIAPNGSIAARYDKIHLFDVALGRSDSQGGRYLESDRYFPGDQAVVVDADGIQVGLSICYDVRFPHLYRALAQAGARVLMVPAAFTRVTGKAHWHTLLCARAIENGAYVIASAQTGEHPGKRQTYGHAVVISPWGEVLADAGEEPGMIVAELDMQQVTKCREKIPSLQHDRAFSIA